MAVDKQTLGAAIGIIGTGGGGGGGEITVDTSISHFSTNPVQNKVIAGALDEKQDKLTFDAVPTAGSANPVTSDGIRRAINAIAPGELIIYGFHIDSTEGDPAACVTYLQDAVGMTPAFMDFTTGSFNWGSWANAFFLPRPCMLNYDGTVAYYLDPDDYTKKADGTASDVADDTFQGNAMMEWGRDGKKIWYKIVPDTNDSTSASVYIADYQADEDYHAWSFINNQGVMVPHFYTPIYDGTLDGNGRLRSISGKAYGDLRHTHTMIQDIAAAELNNPGTDRLWYTEVYADIVLIDLLLILMGKSLNSQSAYGVGRGGYESTDMSGMIGTGTMNTRGLFWGSNSYSDGVKVFGMENWWGNQWRQYAGHVMIDYAQKYKMTRTTADGSTANDYVISADATDYAGYLTGATAPSSDSYIMAMGFDENCFQVSGVGGTASTYWCDRYYQASGVRYFLFGGNSSLTLHQGAFALRQATSTTISWQFGTSVSCKPLA